MSTTNDNINKVAADIEIAFKNAKQLLGADGVIVLIKRIAALKDIFVPKEEYEAYKKQSEGRITNLETAMTQYISESSVNDVFKDTVGI